VLSPSAVKRSRDGRFEPLRAGKSDWRGAARGLAQESMHETGIPETTITAWNGGP